MEAGIDFGTTNSSLARFDGRQVQYFPLDPANKDPRLLPSLIYIPRDRQPAIGFGAARQYIAENVGRPIRYERRYVGDIEIMVAGTGGSPIIYNEQIYAYEDVEAPGRFLQSIKTVLRDENYRGTFVFKKHYTARALIAMILRQARAQAERKLERDLTHVVLGRPVIFSENPEIDTQAQYTLYEAAQEAGFKEVTFELEPVAAAYAYHAQAEKRQTALVFDFGGGTLDFTIVRLGGRQAPEVIATRGILLGGDDIDRRIMRAMEKYFGAGTTFQPGMGGQELPFPSYLTRHIQDWQTLLELATPENTKIIDKALRTGSNPLRIRALKSLVHNNLGFSLRNEAERVKIALSENLYGLFTFKGPHINISEAYTRTRLENQLRRTVRQINTGLDHLLRDAELAAGDVDVVLRTGGSASIPLYIGLLESRFGAEKVVAQDAFTSITAGLAIVAHERYG
ncbi:MAG: Hsp70 family protein [Anaerolineae bacterium]|nr:Hsp70 family protein [Anaerolineae bacterium]